MSNDPVDSLDAFYFNKSEPSRSSLLALRTLILNHHPQISETRKYGMPCFLFNQKIMCYLWLDKKLNLPYILMAKGHLLNHPALVQGDRKRMNAIHCKPDKDLPLASIKEILDLGIALY